MTGALPLSYRAFLECAVDPISIYFNLFRKIFGQNHRKCPPVFLEFFCFFLLIVSEFAMTGALPLSYRAFIECAEDPISIYFDFFRKIFGQKHRKCPPFFFLTSSFALFLLLSYFCNDWRFTTKLQSLY